MWCGWPCARSPAALSRLSLRLVRATWRRPDRRTRLHLHPTPLFLMPGLQDSPEQSVAAMSDTEPTVLERTRQRLAELEAELATSQATKDLLAERLAQAQNRAPAPAPAPAPGARRPRSELSEPTRHSTRTVKPPVCYVVVPDTPAHSKNTQWKCGQPAVKPEPSPEPEATSEPHIPEPVKQHASQQRCLIKPWSTKPAFSPV